jgi:hypothetical protein
MLLRLGRQAMNHQQLTARTEEINTSVGSLDFNLDAYFLKAIQDLGFQVSEKYNHCIWFHRPAELDNSTEIYPDLDIRITRTEYRIYMLEYPLTVPYYRAGKAVDDRFVSAVKSIIENGFVQ